MIAKLTARIAAAEAALRLAKSKVSGLRAECARREGLLLAFLANLSSPKVLPKHRKWLAICEICNRTRVVDGATDEAAIELLCAAGWSVTDGDGCEVWLPADLAFKFFCPTCAIILPERRDKNTWRE